MRTQIQRVALVLLMASALAVVSGCGSTKAKKQNTDFFTSGNREADQRAAQRMAKQEQLSGNGEGSGESDVKKAKSDSKGDTEAAQAENKKTLFERLGGEDGITKIVDDFMPRVLQDPRVNWQRKGVTRGGFWFGRNKSVTWQATPQKIALVKKHFVEFLVLATGGPSHYEGKEMKSVHANMHIANPEFDAAVGDLKATLDRLQIPNTEQKELLAIIESTRPQVVTER